MNIREAILKAADHIEANPQDFKFMRVTVPGGCGTPGCAAGWIGYFLDVRPGSGLNAACQLTGIEGFSSYATFQSRMTQIDNRIGNWRRYFFVSWTENAEACARTLRIYADKYHPAAVAPIAEDRQLVSWSTVAWKPKALA